MTVTALLRVHNCLVQNNNNQKTTALLARGIFAAFYTINSVTLSDRLRLDFHLGSYALNWLRSFLIGKTKYVGLSWSSPVACISGVSQEIALGPLLFAMYISQVNKRRRSTFPALAPVC